MAEQDLDKFDNPASEKQGPSMEKRLLLAFILMAGVLFLTPYIYKPSEPVKKAQPVTPPARTQTVEQVQTPAPAAALALAGRVSASQENRVVVETDLYRVEFSNRGAVVRSWVLKKYKDSAGKPLELVSQAGAAKAGFPFSFEYPGGKAPADLKNALFAPTVSGDGLDISFEHSDGRVAARKSFRFQKSKYLTELTSEVIADGRPVPHVLTWRGGFGDSSVPNHPAALHSLYFDVASNKLVVQQAKAAKNGPVSSVGGYSFAGIEDSYFAAVFLPAGETAVEVRTYSDQVSPAEGAAETPHLGAGVGGSGENHFSVFVGPKDVAILRSVNPKLEQVVDFGWFSIIAKPLFLSLNYVNNRWVHSYGWSIVVVTVIINFLLLPLKFTSLKSMKKMQLLQPQIAAINEKYKGISLRDPRKSEQNQEIMDLYKKHGVNPMGGCMPMLLQIPFFFAYYKVLTVAIELRGAEWLWVSDLSQPETIPIRILPIAMIVTQFIMQKMTPTTTADPMQQRMMLMMPLFLGFMFYGMSSGLVLYWLTGNVVGIAQQWFFNRRVVALPAPVEAPKSKSKKTART
ncbi:MAG: membrane protein insertase YidC [Bryobacteraceae bacterium]